MAAITFAVPRFIDISGKKIVYPCIKIFDEEYSDEISLYDFISMVDLSKNKFMSEGDVDFLDGRYARYSEGKILISLRVSGEIPIRILREREYEVLHNDVRTIYRAAVETLECLRSLAYRKAEGESFKFENMEEVP